MSLHKLVNKDVGERKKNERNLFKYAIPLQKGVCKSAILHTLMGTKVIVLLNEAKKPIKFFGSEKGFYPANVHIVNFSKFSSILLQQEHLNCLYSNSGDGLEEFFAKKPECKVVLYESTLSDLLSNLPLE